jgi:hypothetical protein
MKTCPRCKLSESEVSWTPRSDGRIQKICDNCASLAFSKAGKKGQGKLQDRRSQKEGFIIRIDFSDFPELLEKLKSESKEELRELENHIIYLLRDIMKVEIR